MQGTNPDRITSRIAVRLIQEKTHADPVWFLQNMENEDPWRMQKKIARAVFRRRRVAVKACNSSGKTRVAAGIGLAFFFTYPQCKIITTAPTWTQVERLLWGDVAKIFAKLPIGMGAELLSVEVRGAKDWWMIGLSTDEGVKFQGHHAEKMLIIVDEATGVAPDIFTAINSLSAGGDVHILLLGNPMATSGFFYDAFTTNRDQWDCYTIDAFETPNFASLPGETVDEKVEYLLHCPDSELDDNTRPYLTTRRWVRDMYVELGPKSPQWQAYVRGQFPEQSEDSLISLVHLEYAKAVGERVKPKEVVEFNVEQPLELTAGLDVAGPGEDETSLYILNQWGEVVDFKAWGNPDPRGEVAAALEPYRRSLVQLNVDSIGIGYYMALHLQDLGFPVTQVNVGSSSLDPVKYLNLKAELYWNLRKRFHGQEFHGLTDAKTIAQLSAIRYRHNPHGKIQIESKEEARKRGVKSPDRGEAFMLAGAGTSINLIPFSFMSEITGPPSREVVYSGMNGLEGMPRS